MASQQRIFSRQLTVSQHCGRQQFFTSVFIRCLLLLMMTLLFAVGSTEVDTNDINGFLNSVVSDAENKENDVRKQWGLADTRAIVGKVFRYHIPADAFSGAIHRFEVQETTSSSLPKWLYFNNVTATLEGLATPRDVGQVFVTVRAIGTPESSGVFKSAEDMLSIDVLPARHDSPKARLLKSSVPSCSPSEEMTTMSIMLDADMDALEASKRIELVGRMLKHMDLSDELLRLLPVEVGGSIFDSNTIMAGPGNAKQKHNMGVLLQWQVGCGRHVTDESFVNSIETSSRDGSLAEVLGFPVIGWHLAAVRPDDLATSARGKRQIYFGISTPVPGLLPPTRRPIVTETVHEVYPDSEHEEGGPVPQAVDEDEGPVPDVRIIPTMASPTFGHATTTTPSHRHRHHHELGTHVRGGHHHHNRPHPNEDEPLLTASPTFHYVKGTPIFSTPSPTPVFAPIHPTRPYVPPDTEDTTDPYLQPSVDLPGGVHTVTEPLPVPTFTHGVTSDIPMPTRVSETPVIVTTSVYEPGVFRKNFKPVMRNRIPKLVFIAGKISRYSIPTSTFFDFEDGETPSLKLIFTNADGTALQSTSWVQFNSNNQEIYAIPLEENIGKWEFSLEAMDSEGDSVRETVEVHVRQHPSSRAVHHEFVVQLKYDKWRFAANIDWQIRFAEKLAIFFGDRNDQSIVVRSVTTNPDVFTWTNESLPTHPCPQEKIHELLHMMVSNREGSVSKHLRKVMAQEFRLSRVTVNLLGHCNVKVPPTSTTHVNVKPMVRNHIDHINATVGEFLHFPVQEDTFFDVQDGNTRNLKLMFLTIDGAAVPQSSWIQFNAATQEFIGLPMGEDVGSRQYQLVAMDKEGLSATDALVVAVHRRPDTRPPSVEFSIRIDYDFYAFNNDLTKKVMVLDKLAHVYGDPDPRYISVRYISPGSVVFTWSNTTLPVEPCPKEQVGRLVKIMFNDNGTVSRRLLDTFQPEFNITGADVIPLGVCLADITPTSISVGPTATVETEHATSDDDIYITTIIPAIVIAAMLLIAAIIACVLYRKKRKGKMTMDDSGNFVSKGIPIIFADELEDKPDPAKSPVIMKEEKPPLPPPEYPRSSGSGSPSTPPVDRKRHLERHDDDLIDQVENTPPYQPPPPFTASRDSRLSRPKHTPTYRLPPPYVPP